MHYAMGKAMGAMNSSKVRATLKLVVHILFLGVPARFNIEASRSAKLGLARYVTGGVGSTL